MKKDIIKESIRESKTWIRCCDSRIEELKKEKSRHEERIRNLERQK